MRFWQQEMPFQWKLHGSRVFARIRISFVIREYNQKVPWVISNFSGSAGYAIILKKKNYLFVDGRYTLQAKLESGDNFEIIDHQKIINCDLFKKLTIGIDPKLFTSSQVEKFFSKKNNVKKIEFNLIDNIHKNHSK